MYESINYIVKYRWALIGLLEVLFVFRGVYILFGSMNEEGDGGKRIKNLIKAMVVTFVIPAVIDFVTKYY